MQYSPSPPHFPSPLPLLPDPPTLQSMNSSSHSILSQSKRKNFPPFPRYSRIKSGELVSFTLSWSGTWTLGFNPRGSVF